MHSVSVLDTTTTTTKTLFSTQMEDYKRFVLRVICGDFLIDITSCEEKDESIPPNWTASLLEPFCIIYLRKGFQVKNQGIFV